MHTKIFKTLLFYHLGPFFLIRKPETRYMRYTLNRHAGRILNFNTFEVFTSDAILVSHEMLPKRWTVLEIDGDLFL